MGGQDQSLEEKEAAVGFPADRKSAPGNPDDRGQSRGGENDPSQDDEDRRKRQPFPEKAGQPEKHRRGVDSEKTPGAVQSAPIITKNRFPGGAGLW